MTKKKKIEDVKMRFAAKQRELNAATNARDNAVQAADREDAERRRAEILEELDGLEEEAASLGCGEAEIVLRRAIAFLTHNVRVTGRAPFDVLQMCRELVAA